MHMGSHRVHVVLAAEERAAYRAAAAREGVSLSEWLRGAARARLADRSDLRTVDDLDAFFADCDRRGGDETEPDWSSHRAVIESSRRSGLPA